MNDFESLDLNQKAEIAWNGNFLGSMNYYNFKLNLYTLKNGRFVEVWYSPFENRIADIKLVSETDLQKWLNRINLQL
jgi:hypothetical protein